MGDTDDLLYILRTHLYNDLSLVPSENVFRGMPEAFDVTYPMVTLHEVAGNTGEAGLGMMGSEAQHWFEFPVVQVDCYCSGYDESDRLADEVLNKIYAGRVTLEASGISYIRLMSTRPLEDDTRGGYRAFRRSMDFRVSMEAS